MTHRRLPFRIATLCVSLLVAGLLAAGCEKNRRAEDDNVLPPVDDSMRASMTVSLGEAFTLPFGSTANIEGTGDRVKIIDVHSDSRAPAGVQSFWQGSAKVVVAIVTHDREEHTITLTTREGLRRGDVFRGAVAGYDIELVDLRPQPIVDHEIILDNYRPILIVTRATKDSAPAGPPVR